MPDEAASAQSGAQKERSFETGMDEAFKHFSVLTGMNAKVLVDAWMANIKRTYDEYQHESLESIRRNRTIVDKLVSDAQQHDNQRQNIANQALQNAVETANMVGKQAVRHGDVAIDRQWNVDEQGYTAAEIIKSMTEAQTFKDAIQAAVANAVNAAVSQIIAAGGSAGSAQAPK